MPQLSELHAKQTRSNMQRLDAMDKIRAAEATIHAADKKIAFRYKQLAALCLFQEVVVHL